MWSILNLGLSYGNDAYNDPTGAGADFTWWTSVTGNWNCVRPLPRLFRIECLIWLCRSARAG